MVSLINPDVPQSPNAYTADLRANAAAAKSEIEDLQAAVDALGPGGPLDFLPLTGGTLSGPLVLPLGSAGSPALEFGSPATGFFIQGGAGGNLYLRVNGTVAWVWGASGPIVLQPFDLDSQRIINLGPATAGTDALNRNVADARYAPVDIAQQVAELRREVDRLRQLLQRREVPVGVGMRTEILAPPT
jgi:hypothetical protein